MSRLSRKVAAKYVVPLEEDEMLVRYIEASEGLKRPPGVSAVQALSQLGGDPEELVRIRKGLRAIMDYWREQIASMQRSN